MYMEEILKGDWLKESKKTTLHTCQYNRAVDCDDSKDCSVCGWNPFVSLYRITKKYGEKAGDYLTKPGS